MKTALLLALSTAVAASAMAVEVHPDPGMALEAQPFNDLRLVLGSAAPITHARAVGVDYDTNAEVSPRVGFQYIHGVAGDSLGGALGIEVAYDDHLGNVSRSTGVHTYYGNGDTRLREVSVGLLPKFVLRPGFDDPIEWPPGSVQLEIGPVLAAGIGWARIGGSSPTDPTTVLRWGARMDLVWTMPSRWQLGISAAYEGVTAKPQLRGDASIDGDGFCGGLILGRRM